jgi:hypothetical protein
MGIPHWGCGPEGPPVLSVYAKLHVIRLDGAAPPRGVAPGLQVNYTVVH